MGNVNYKLSGSKLIFIFFALLFLAGCNKDNITDDQPKYQLRISFKNKAGSDGLVLNNTYTNPHSEAITFTAFKYYISNISLIDVAGNETKLPDTYFLVNQEDPGSTSFTVNAPGTEYKAIRYWIGVDSARNVSGVQTGALDPANEMFWTWTTGYIMAKMEGVSPVSPAPLSAVTYHIGGFKTGENSLRQISLTLPVNVLLKTISASEVVINADAMAWFKGVHDIKIADEAFCMNPGTLAMNIADNYAKMFTVQEVKNQ